MANVRAPKTQKFEEEERYEEWWRMQHNHFAFHMKNNQKYAREEDRCHACQWRSFATDRTAKTSVVNHVKGDHSVLDPDFRFIENSVYTREVEPIDPNSLTGCDCEDDLQCMKGDCECMGEIEEGETVDAKINAYHCSGDRKGCLRASYLRHGYPIYECNDRCSCSDHCSNKVVGRGRQTSLEVFRTNDGRGWGLRSTHDIKRGSFVGTYVGEVITPQEANRRRAKAIEDGVAGRKPLYLFALDKFTDKDSKNPKLQEAYEIDGEYMAGPTRFINHSCSPNLQIFAVVNDLALKHVHELAFFAREDISRLTELTFDYAANVDVNDEERNMDLDEPRGKFREKCLCGSKECRGYLWT